MAAMVSNAVFSYAQTDKSNEKGWTNLFDGKTLNGWKSVGGNKRYAQFFFDY